MKIGSSWSGTLYEDWDKSSDRKWWHSRVIHALEWRKSVLVKKYKIKLNIGFKVQEAISLFVIGFPLLLFAMGKESYFQFDSSSISVSCFGYCPVLNEFLKFQLHRICKPPHMQGERWVVAFLGLSISFPFLFWKETMWSLLVKQRQDQQNEAEGTEACYRCRLWNRAFGLRQIAEKLFFSPCLIVIESFNKPDEWNSWSTWKSRWAVLGADH